MTMGELLRHYEKHARPRMRRRTWLNRKSLLRAVQAELGDRELEALQPEDLDGYAERRLGAGLQRVSVNNELRALRRLLNFGRARRHYAGALEVELLQEDEQRVRFWSSAEVDRLLLELRKQSPRLVPVVVLIANTGCRRGEALALEWQRVNFDRGLIEFWPSKDWRPKSGRPREVPMSTELRQVLERLPRRSERWVFPAATGERWAYWPQLQFDRARRAAGLVGGPHTLRHTFASLFLSRCADLPLLALLLGHSDARVTRLYAHLLPDHLERARNVVRFAPPAVRGFRRGSASGTRSRKSSSAIVGELVARLVRGVLDIGRG